ncbi:MAG: DNA-binding response regulator [Sulfurospirillum sp.]|nr:MAG: DNA-binding response regulator [Sulfurospirillum sp.]
MHIVLLEDDQLLNNAITDYLQKTGHLVESFRDGKEALERIRAERFDLLVLDINVPGLDGLSLLERLHEEKIQTPAIYISALIDIEEISRAYDLGCYDYLKKPFHLKELTLRINKIMQTRTLDQKHFRLSENYSFDTASCTLFFQNEVQTVTSRQLQILDLLAHNRNRTVTYDMFRDYVYNDMGIDNTTIIAEINRLRKVLKEDFITNIRAVGYIVKRPE